MAVTAVSPLCVCVCVQRAVEYRDVYPGTMGTAVPFVCATPPIATLWSQPRQTSWPVDAQTLHEHKGRQKAGAYDHEVLPSTTMQGKAVTFKVNRKTRYQQMFGFGGAATDAATINTYSLSLSAAEKLIRYLCCICVVPVLYICYFL
ncbi:hypothetical protein PR048_006609 [Dryococelus australis]|uniref:Uncharacterized protein n=1 Tax=Dryococelus australis TaxID=614101 RepID=A0ABQ9IBI5_9NEOP|nr:hypothetical protein PR048_006609 [Dryococelus australis]